MNSDYSIAKFLRFVKSRPRIYQYKNLLHYHMSARKEVLKYKPLYIFMAITDQCPFKCKMCQGHSEIMKNYYGRHQHLPDMSLETFKNIVEHYKECVNISLVGSGEPLSNKYFFEMVEYAKKVRRTRVTTLSNGIITDDNMRSLLGCGLDAISISLKGYNAQDFFRLTGVEKHVFYMIIDNIRKLVTLRHETGSRLQIYVSFIVDKQNYGYISTMVQLAQNLGINKVKFDAFLPYPIEGCSLDERCITSEDKEIVNFLRNIKHNDDTLEIRPLTILDLNQAHRICTSPFTTLRVDSAGNVGACNIKLLNLEKNGVYTDPDVWNNDYFRQLRKSFLNKNLHQPPEACLTCYEYAGKSKG